VKKLGNVSSFIRLAFVIIVIWVYVVSVSNPMHNLISWQMILGSVFLSAVMLAGYWFLEIKCGVAISRNVWIVLILAYFILAYLVACCYGNHWQGLPLADYSNVYLGALNIAEGNELENEFYFLIYGNNIKPMLMLSWLIRFARCIGIQNEYYLLLFFSIGSITLALASLLYLLRKDSIRVIAMLLFVGCIPVWFYNSIFYTDTLSFSSAIISIALLEKAKTIVGHILSSAIWCFLAVVTITIGVNFKITAIIPIIAYIFVCAIEKKLSVKRLLMVICFAVILESALVLIYNSYPITQKSKETSDPILSWIGLGLKGDGSWSSGSDYVHNLHELSSKSEKDAYVEEYIKKNYREAYTVEHFKAKTRFNYASGNFGTHGLVSEAQSGKVFREMFDPYGRLYWRASQYCLAYILSIYLVSMVSAVAGIVRRTKTDGLLATGYLAFVGMFLFLMIWEANNRQLYNQIPIMILTTTLSIESLIHEKRMAK
jgi:hypothetical protein